MRQDQIVGVRAVTGRVGPRWGDRSVGYQLNLKVEWPKLTLHSTELAVDLFTMNAVFELAALTALVCILA